MFRNFCKVGAVAALLLGSAAAGAAPISGAISPSDGFTPAPVGGTSIVSSLTQFNLSPSANVNCSAATGDLATMPLGCPGVAGTLVTGAFSLTDPNGPANTGTLLFSSNGFNIYLMSVSNIDPDALLCSAGGLCTDNINFDWAGYITGPGAFVQTAWLGNFTANGSCLGSGASCTGPATASWSASIVATGEQQGKVPEPGTLALLGLGLAGLAVTRRRKQ